MTDKALREDELAATSKGSECAELPWEFLEWQKESRLALFETISKGGMGAVKTMPSHLAVVASLAADGSINMATKGIGVIPKPDVLEGFTAAFRSTANACKGIEWRMSLERRVRTLLSLYLDLSNMDTTRLGGLEIFEGRTYENLKNDPRASLLFTGEAPKFVSFQIDGQVEFVNRGDPYYEFLLAARELFARDGFHVNQSSYPHGFVFRVSRVTDKRPFTRMGPHV